MTARLQRGHLTVAHEEPSRPLQALLHPGTIAGTYSGSSAVLPATTVPTNGIPKGSNAAIGSLIRAIDEGAFYFIQKPFDRRVLLTLVNRCLELREPREQREQFLRRVERELEVARQFQLSLLPPTGMELPGLSIAARYLACNELAGDIYDYVEASDGAVAVLIADVVGHGTSAAMMTGVVKAAFRASHVDGFEPMAVVDRVKEGIRDFDPSRFVSLCCARIDPRRGELRYVNAGHPEPIIRSGAARPILLDSTGPILG